MTFLLGHKSQNCWYSLKDAVFGHFPFKLEQQDGTNAIPFFKLIPDLLTYL